MNAYHKYSWLSLIRTLTGNLICSNYRGIRIIESILWGLHLDRDWELIRIIERFKWKKYELAKVHCQIWKKTLVNIYRVSMELYNMLLWSVQNWIWHSISFELPSEPIRARVLIFFFFKSCIARVTSSVFPEWEIKRTISLSRTFPNEKQKKSASRFEVENISGGIR